MIKGKIRTAQSEAKYFEMPQDSYSTLKTFSTNRLKFYKKYVEKDPKYQIDDESVSLALGNMVDCLITGTEKEFHERFDFISSKRGSGQLWEFGEVLWRLTQFYTNSEGELSVEFSDMAEEAFKQVKYDKSGNEVAFKGKDISYLYSTFKGSDAEILYEERRNKSGKTIVTISEMQLAENIAEKLRNTPWTAEFLSIESSRNFEVHYQLPSVFSIEDLPLKSKIDIVHIDHIAKVIQPFDLKVTHLINNFDYAYWIKNKYYIQEAIYHNAVEAYQKTRDELKEYTILPMIFIVADSSNLSMPILYTSSVDNYNTAFNGATGKNGYKIRGVKELIRELQWAQESGNWFTSKEVVENKGIVRIKQFDSTQKEEE